MIDIKPSRPAAELLPAQLSDPALHRHYSGF
jgi:hypothetical protein